MMTFLAASMVASKGILSPLASFFFNVTRPSTLVSVSAVSSVLRIASLNVSVIVLLTSTSVTPSAGSKVTVGGSASTVVKVEFAGVMGLPSASVTPAQIATYTNCILGKSSVGLTLMILLPEGESASQVALFMVPLFELLDRSVKVVPVPSFIFQ